MRKILSCEFNLDTACVELALAVSYTHLDVYKRQEDIRKRNPYIWKRRDRAPRENCVRKHKDKRLER